MQTIKEQKDPEGVPDTFPEKNPKLAMTILALVLLIFLAGVSSVLVLQKWPEIFGRMLFSFK